MKTFFHTKATIHANSFTIVRNLSCGIVVVVFEIDPGRVTMSIQRRVLRSAPGVPVGGAIWRELREAEDTASWCRLPQDSQTERLPIFSPGGGTWKHKKRHEALQSGE